MIYFLQFYDPTEYPFNTNTDCEQQTVGKSKEIYCVHNIDYVEPKSSEINVVAMSSQFYGKICNNVCTLFSILNVNCVLLNRSCGLNKLSC
jgi:hypothetical protein